MEGVWRIAEKAVATREVGTKQSLCEALGEAPKFGSGESTARAPGFFAKELTEDLLQPDLA